MAHEINRNDTFGEIRSRGDRAWHGLGIEIPTGLTARDAFPKIGLAWETELLPVFAEMPTADVVSQPDGTLTRSTKRIALPDSRAHVRSDDGTVLGIVSSGYKPVQNLELADFADALVGADATVEIETAGSLYDNRRVFALVRLPKSIEVTKQDVLEQYVLISNGHGGFASFSAYPTSVRVVCANTLRWSEKDGVRGVRFMHTGKMDDKLKVARSVLGLAVREQEQFEAQVRALAGCDLSVGQVREFMEKAYDDCFGRARKEDVDEETMARLQAAREETLATWMANMENEKQSMPGVRGTAWAAYNAVSEYHDHQRGRVRADSQVRIHSNLFGASQRDKLSTFRLALATAGAR